METFRITFFREDDPDEEKSMGEIRELMAVDETDALMLFKHVEPFATIVKIEKS